ncbi:MAG: hypothetical protein RIC35_01275 [Marinoscillum sp.]
MAKRQVRVAIDQLLTFVTRNENLNIVMTDGSVFLVNPTEVKSGVAKVKNTKGHILHLPLAQIEEIWAEVKAN